MAMFLKMLMFTYIQKVDIRSIKSETCGGPLQKPLPRSTAYALQPERRRLDLASIASQAISGLIRRAFVGYNLIGSSEKIYSPPNFATVSVTKNSNYCLWFRARASATLGEPPKRHPIIYSHSAKVSVHFKIHS